MKFGTTLLLLTSLVVALPSEDNKDSSTIQSTCVNAISCKIEQLKKDKANNKNLESCEYKSDESDKTKCTLEALGLKSEQIEQLIKLDKFITKCVSIPDAAFTKCTEKCKDEKKKDECINKCKESMIAEIGKCTIKAAEKPDFDLKESAKCTSKCNQATLPEVFKCDYDCNKVLYEALISKSDKDSLTENDSKDSKDGKDDKAKDDKTKDGKSGDSTDKDKDGKSNAMTIYSMSSFGSMAVGTIIFTLLF